jgi:NADPH:quinone reductase-like Zn-dependent oxidoreductase
MKAIVQERYGSPDRLSLKDIDTPTAARGQVLVRVHAASVNPPEWAILSGVPYIARPVFGFRRPRIRVRGTDLAGTVAAVGPDVTAFKVGDEVFGAGVGTFAEFAVAPESQLAPKPANLTFEQAAAVPMAGLTALQALRDKAGVKAGMKVLIIGAGGGIGTFAVQLAKAWGAEVTGVCGTDKVDLVRSLGADHVIDYTREDVTVGPALYDVIFDNVSRLPLSRLLRIATPDGTVIPNGGRFDRHWVGGALSLLVGAPVRNLFASQHIRTVLEHPNRADLLVLKELIESGAVTPAVGATYPLARGADAVRAWGTGHTRGKLVLTP